LTLNRTGLFAVNNSFFITSAGRVGIGTTSPAGMLEISGNHQLKTRASTVDNAEWIYTSKAGQNWQNGVFDVDGTYRIAADSAGLNDNVAVTIDTSGNVGIGTTVPLSILDIIGNFTIHQNNFTNFVNVTTNAVVFTERWNGTCLIQRNLVSGNNWTKC